MPRPQGDEDDVIEAMRAKREKLGMTQSALGKALGTSQEMISLVEAKKKLLPKELAVFVRRWLRSGQLPTADEIASVRSNPGR